MPLVTRPAACTLTPSLHPSLPSQEVVQSPRTVCLGLRAPLGTVFLGQSSITGGAGMVVSIFDSTQTKCPTAAILLQAASRR